MSQKLTKMEKKEDVKRTWYLVNVAGKVLGRASTAIASLLIGKHKIKTTHHVDIGDSVVVINASKIKVTGNKLKDKIYTTYSGYPSGLKKKSLEELLKTKPTDAIRLAVSGMLPKNKLGSRMITRLKIYKDDKHPHVAQNCAEIKI